MTTSVQRNIPPAISVRDLCIGYGDRIVLQNLSFDIPYGQIVAVLGGSGCGKSTLLKHMIGLYPPRSGQILLDGVNIVSATPLERAAILPKFGVAFQGGALFRSMSLFENVALPMQEQYRWTPDQIAQRVREKLKLVQLDGYEDFMPSDLSGGMIKRGAFARALALDPKILFFDEPSAGLDPLSSSALDQLMLSIREQTGATIVIVTHELDSIFTVADRVLVLSREERGLIGDGDPRVLRDHAENPYIRTFLNRGNLPSEVTPAQQGVSSHA